MNAKALLARINGLIEKADHGAIDEVETWHQQGLACIRAIYSDKEIEDTFRHIRFYPYVVDVMGPGPTDAESGMFEREGIAEAVSQLEGARTFLEFKLPVDDAELETVARETPVSHDTGQLIDRIEAHIITGQVERMTDMNEWRSRSRLYLKLVYGDPSSEVYRFEQIIWGANGVGSSGFLEVGPFKAPLPEPPRPGFGEAIAMLQTALEEIEMGLVPFAYYDQAIGPGSEFHSLVVDAAGNLIRDGHFAAAAKAAAAAIETELKRLLDRPNAKAFALVGQAFSLDAPEPDKKRLRFPEFDQPGTPEEQRTNAHLGAMHFGQGCVQRIRNLYTHGQKVTDAEALEALTSISLLARWVEQAEVVHFEEDA